MKVAQAKLEMIRPEEVNLEEYEVMCFLRGQTIDWGILWFTDLPFILAQLSTWENEAYGVKSYPPKFFTASRLQLG